MGAVEDDQPGDDLRCGGSRVPRDSPAPVVSGQRALDWGGRVAWYATRPPQSCPASAHSRKPRAP